MRYANTRHARGLSSLSSRLSKCLLKINGVRCAGRTGPYSVKDVVMSSLIFPDRMKRDRHG